MPEADSLLPAKALLPACDAERPLWVGSGCSAQGIKHLITPTSDAPHATGQNSRAEVLALFAVAGTEKALAYGIHPSTAVPLGAITAVGGGVVRDVLLAQIPAVLRVDIYATAALAGSLVMVAGARIGVPRTTAAILGGAVCFTLRMLAVWQNWQLPKAGAF